MTRARRAAIGCGAITVVVAMLVAGAITYVSRPDPGSLGAPSIERDAWYHEDARLDRAWALPVAATYRARFVAQRNGSFCGPASLVNVLRSTGTDADQDAVLDGTGVATVLGLLPGGMTLDALADVARERLPGRTVTVQRDLDLGTFRALMRRANDPAVRMIVNFHRGPLFARGGGHHSPVGGYLEDEDLVFVLDVNDDYDPWLARTERVFAATDTIDPASGLERGVLLIE